jgi:CHASE3 domain sensor protein
VKATDVPGPLTTSASRMPTMRFGSLILAVALLAATGILGIVTVAKMKASRDQVIHTYMVQGLLKDLRSDIGDSHANFDLYQLSRNPNEGQDLEEQSQEQILIIGQLHDLTKDNPSNRRA